MRVPAGLLFAMGLSAVAAHGGAAADGSNWEDAVLGFPESADKPILNAFSARRLTGMAALDSIEI